MIDGDTLKKAFSLMKSEGLGTFMKDIAKNPEWRQMLMDKIQPMWDDFVQKYNVEDVDYHAEGEVLKATLYVSDDEDREEMRKNLLDFITDLQSHWLFKMIVREYEISNIHCEEVDEGVYLEIKGNEKLGDHINSMKGGMIDGEPESGEKGDGEEGDESGDSE